MSDTRRLSITVDTPRGVQFCTLAYDYDDQGIGGPVASLALDVLGESFRSRGDTCWEALVNLRQSAEQKQYVIRCNGSLRRVQPSPMILSMGEGEKAYRLTLGLQARNSDLLNIIEPADDVETEFATVSEQKDFYQKWLKSLRPPTR